MEKIVMTIKVNQVNVANKFHLSVQQHCKGGFFRNKKAYDRKRLPKIDY